MRVNRGRGGGGGGGGSKQAPDGAGEIYQKLISVYYEDKNNFTSTVYITVALGSSGLLS